MNFEGHYISLKSPFFCIPKAANGAKHRLSQKAKHLQGLWCTSTKKMYTQTVHISKKHLGVHNIWKIYTDELQSTGKYIFNSWLKFICANFSNIVYILYIVPKRVHFKGNITQISRQVENISCSFKWAWDFVKQKVSDGERGIRRFICYLVIGRSIYL